MSGRDVEERRQAFTGLLATPVIARVTHVRLWPLIRRHRPVLTEWFGDRLGYRLVVSDDTARLYRLPIEGAVVAPRRAVAPSRRILVLALLVAAAAEDADDLTTVQELSDRVRALASRDDVPVSTYDPDRFAERQLFVRAVDLVVELGGLRPSGRAGEDSLTGWAHRTDAIGGAYHLQREVLLRLIDPVALAAALGRHGEIVPDERSRRFTLMRRLLELPVCLLADLTESEHGYLVSQRHRLFAWCREMTGWSIEQRREGIALVPQTEEGTDRPFPKVRADHFGALMVLDRLLAEPHDLVGREAVSAAAHDVVQRYPKAMTTSFKDDPESLADAAEVVLSELDLLRPWQDGWRVMPVAARFRSPDPVAVSRQQSIDEGDE